MWTVATHSATQSAPGGGIVSSAGKSGEGEIFDQEADWVDAFGTIAGGVAGVAVFPYPGHERHPWFVRDYGIITVNPFRQAPFTLPRGESLTLSCGFYVHDGHPSEADISGALDVYASQVDRP